MKSTKELLGARIKELRKACKFSQEELAEMIGVEPQHMSRVESGRSYPSLDRLEKISMALNVPRKDFFEFTHLADSAERLVSLRSLWMVRRSLPNTILGALTKNCPTTGKHDPRHI